MKKLVNLSIKKKILICLFLFAVFVVSSIVTLVLIENSKDNEYKYYTMPNGTMIKYKGKTIEPDANGIIVIPKGGASIVAP